MEEVFVGIIVGTAIVAVVFRGYRKLASSPAREIGTQAGCSGECEGCSCVRSESHRRSVQATFRRRTTISMVVAAFCFASPARAVDTVETWDVGATDLDFYVGYDGFGLSRADRQLSSNLMAGFGIIERLSAYLAATISSDELFDQGAGEVNLGIFGTGVETDHVDLDLFLDFSIGGEGFSEFQVAPALELNLDLAPDLRTWGVYFLLALPIYGREPIADGSGGGRETATHIEATVGTYVTIGERHQILVDYEMAFHPMARGDDPSVEIGSVGFGYNVVLHDSIELITEVRVDIPAEGEDPSVGFMTGFIATLPSGRGGEPLGEELARDGDDGQG